VRLKRPHELFKRYRTLKKEVRREGGDSLTAQPLSTATGRFLFRKHGTGSRRCCATAKEYRIVAQLARR